MPIFRQTQPGMFERYEREDFRGWEQLLEDWIERNPHLIVEEGRLAIIGRQPRNEFGKLMDLLAVDQTGACVVVELKKGVTPRDVIAQTLEYAAWVDSLSSDQLDSIAQVYATKRQIGDVASVRDLYDAVFGEEEREQSEVQDAEGGSPSSRVTFKSLPAPGHCGRGLFRRSGADTQILAHAVCG